MTEATGWAPDACTLSMSDRTARVAEFGSLFADAIRAVDRVRPTHLRLWIADTARDRAVRLVEAESSCCSFFAFEFGESTRGRFALDVRVPPARAAVLDGLTEQASASERRA